MAKSKTKTEEPTTKEVEPLEAKPLTKEEEIAKKLRQMNLEEIDRISSLEELVSRLLPKEEDQENLVTTRRRWIHTNQTEGSK
jgi:hypothetical protein